MLNKIKKYTAIIRTSCLSLAATFMSIIMSTSLFEYTIRAIKEYGVVFDTYIQSLLLQIFVFAIVVVPVILIYYYFDNVDLFSKRDYFESKAKASLLKSPAHLTGFAISMLASTTIFTSSWHLLLSFIFPGIDGVFSRFLSVLLMMLIRLVQLKLLQNKWDTEIKYPVFAEKAMFKRNRDMYEFKVIQLILQPIGYCIVFFAVASIASTYSIPIIFSLLSILTSPGILIVLIPSLAAIIAAIIALRFLWNLRPRRKLIKYLNSLEKRKLATIKYNGPKYLSSAFASLEFTFELTCSNGDKYNCIVVTAGKVNAPLFFKRNEFLVERGAHMRGGLVARGGAFAQAVSMDEIVGNKENPTNMIAGYKIAYELKFPDTEGQKTVIVNPVSTAIFALSDTSAIAKPIDTGEKLFDYTVYNATGFHNHIERSSGL